MRVTLIAAGLAVRALSLGDVLAGLLGAGRVGIAEGHGPSTVGTARVPLSHGRGISTIGGTAVRVPTGGIPIAGITAVRIVVATGCGCLGRTAGAGRSGVAVGRVHIRGDGDGGRTARGIVRRVEHGHDPHGRGGRNQDADRGDRQAHTGRCERSNPRGLPCRHGPGRGARAGPGAAGTRTPGRCGGAPRRAVESRDPRDSRSLGRGTPEARQGRVGERVHEPTARTGPQRKSGQDGQEPTPHPDPEVLELQVLGGAAGTAVQVFLHDLGARRGQGTARERTELS